MASRKNNSNQKNSSCDLNPQSIQFLGLNKQPFAAEILSVDGFFKNPALDKITENLVHQIQFSDLVLLVEGPHGSGKTTLFRQLIQTHINNTKVLSVQAEATDTLTQIQQKISLHLQDLGDINHLDDNLKSLQMFDQTPLIILDNSHVLSDTTLQELFRYQTELKQQQEVNLKILLFANTGMSVTLQKVTDLQPDQMYVQHMPVYIAKQMAAFIHHRLRNAAYSAEPLFNEPRLQQLMKKCDGTPLSIMQESASMIDKIISDKITPPTASWVKGLILILLLLILATAGAFYLGFFDNALEPSQSSIDSQLNDSDSANTDIAMTQQATSANSLYKSPVIIDEVDITEEADTDAAMLPEPRTEIQSKTQPEVLQEAIEIEQAAEPLIETEELSSAQTSVDSAKNTLNPNILIEDKPLKTDQSAPATTQTTTQKTAAPITPPVTSSITSSVPPPTTQSRKTPAPQQQIVAKLHPALQQLNVIGVQNASWIQQQPASAWTLQLLGARDPETLLKFVRQYQMPAGTAWYKSWLNGKPYYVLINGSYPNRDAARNDIASLPAAVRALKPWVKSMKSAQQAIN